MSSFCGWRVAIIMRSESVTHTETWGNFRWTSLNLLNVTSITATADWMSMIDDPFQVNTALPSWDPLP